MGDYLIAASPIPGHVLPLLHVGADLRARGHRVTVLTGAEHRADVTSRGLAYLRLPSRAHPRRDGGGLRALPPLLDRWYRGRSEMRSVFIDPLPAQYRALRKALRANMFDAVLCDVAFTGALPLLTGHGPRPWIAVGGVGPLTVSSADTPPFGAAFTPRVDVNYEAMTWVTHRLLFADVRTGLNDALASVGAPPSPVFLTDWPLLADRVLQFTVPSLEYARSDLPSTVAFTGPVLPPAAPQPRGLPWDLAGDPRSVVHVTQGTWDNDDLDALLRPTIDALADREDVLVVATTGRSDRSALPGPVPANAYVTDFLPYAELLPHVDVMVTNGGYGGVHQALAHGVPLVVAGGTADKPEVAARVAHAGVGINLATSRPGRSALAAAVDAVLTIGCYRTAARRLRREIRGVDALDRIAEILEGLAVPGARSGTLVG
ncbi:glycosyltransferase [Mycolicibacterium holsaticum]|uniref:glycosyltransferase n=1 Tax=Mycolicibacterium holsaticum TaxID=152142 RepID=UPI001C7D1395|nr:glycosyltransferase [Mycolicibacterium holsaticum]MDA4108858.1 UDP-glucuronosyltransferase [Mycolicibacterium holsaticum DSM 44478 = JCM 12374]QZA12443.1 glycosyltransferase [Mycolicibacterium holsaticum DSM 44478 = JCM 12374]UNC10075.1 glycosyltransferase family 1 protein [Mycolicibacterium holsaticum DSM 44478 = JCM 12374]